MGEFSQTGEPLFKGLPPTQYDVILADPPWLYYGSPDKWAAAGKEYRLLSDEQIFQLPIQRLLAPNGILFLWATGPRLNSALDCLTKWGLSYLGVAFVWVKTRQDGAIMGASGVRPRIVKPTTEFVLAASRVSNRRPMPLADESVAQVICDLGQGGEDSAGGVVFSSRGKHSEKPREVHTRIERLYPNARRLELFARSPAVGWDVWGNEITTEY